MAQDSVKWIMQITPTRQGIAKNPAWKHFPGAIGIYTKADRDRRVREAQEALWCGDISAFRCDPI